MEEKKIQIKRQKVIETVQPDGSTVANVTAENVYPILDSDTVKMNDGSTLTESLLNMNAEDYSETITQDYHIDRVGGDTYKSQAKSGKITDVKLYGRTVNNLVGDHGTSPIVTNGNDTFTPNEGMDERVNVIDGQMDELIIKGNSTYNILPDRTCCTDDVEVSEDNTKAFSFKDGLDSRIMLDTGLSDKMVLKGNTLTNIVRDPIGYASVHEVQDNIVPGSSENVRVLNNIITADNRIIEHTVTDSSSITTIFADGSSKGTLKNNTRYTIIMDVLENTLDSTNSNGPVKIQMGYGDNNFVNIGVGFTGRYVNLVTTTSKTFTTGILLLVRSGSTVDAKFSFKNFMVIEGDCSDIAANLPYFKGTLSINMENYDESRPKLVSGDCDRTKIYGQTLVDVLGSNRYATSKKITTESNSTRRLVSVSKFKDDTILKPDTYYVIRFKISDLNLDGLNYIRLAIGCENESTRIINEGAISQINSNGIYQLKVKTISNFSNSTDGFSIKGYDGDWEKSGSTTRTLTISEVSMYEYQEGMENWDLPYMVGEMRGTGLAKIESIVNGGDKELVDVLGETRTNLSKTFTVGDFSTRSITILDLFNTLKPSTDYIIRFKISNLNLDGLINDANNFIRLTLNANYNAVNDNEDHFEAHTLLVNSNGIYSFKLRTLASEPKDRNLYLKGLPGDWEETTSKARTLTISEVSLYEYTPDMDNMELSYMLGTKRMGYYGERKRTYTLPSGLELRSLPNGVRDEFDFESGILTRRVGEKILGASNDSWNLPDGFSNENFTTGFIRIDRVKGVTKIWCKEKPVYYEYNDLLNKSVVMPETYSESVAIWVSVPTNNLSAIDNNSFKNYMIDNPITVQYELATPEYIDYSKDILEDGEYKVGERINGYQDGYNPTTGKYIKRVDKVVLDGINKKFTMIDTYEPVHRIVAFCSYISGNIKCEKNDPKIDISYIKCNNPNIKCMDLKSWRASNYFQDALTVGGDGRIVLRINKTKLFENSLEGINDYLSRNPLTIYYVLANEVESDMTQEQFNALTNRANPKLHYFKDGSLKCTCLSGQPKGQLRINTPTSNYYDMQLIKPNTQYTVNNFSNMYIDGNKYQTSSVTPNQLTTPNTITSKKIVVNTNTDSIYPMMVEGVHDVNDIRFFGMKSSNVLMNTRGKNLFNKDAVIEGKYQDCNYVNDRWGIVPNVNFKISEFIPIKPNTRYKTNGNTGGAFYDINKNVIKLSAFSIDPTPSNARYLVMNFNIDSDLSNFMFYEASESDTIYEPYAQPHEFKAFVKDANGVLQAVELNRINDDLCDEIDLSTGVITRRVGKIKLKDFNDQMNQTLDLTESAGYIRVEWNWLFDGDHLNLLPATNNNYKYRSNILKLWNYLDPEGIKFIQNVNNGQMRMLFNLEKLASDNIDGIKKYINENNIEIIYELDVPYTEQAYIMIDREFKTSLMLPNGVADGYNPITKVKTSRVGVKTYDGNYNGTYVIEKICDQAIELKLTNSLTDPAIRDTTDYSFYSPQLISKKTGNQVTRIAVSESTAYITLPKEKVGINSATLLQYLSSNPITVYYQKANKTTSTLDSFDYTNVVNNFPLANQYGYKVENTNEIKLSKVIHHLPTKNMLYVPLLQPNTKYYLTAPNSLVIDGVSINKSGNILITPTIINNKKIIVPNTDFYIHTHSLIKYTGYIPNLNRIWNGYLRTDAISSSTNPIVTGYSKNLVNFNTSTISPDVSNDFFKNLVASKTNGNLSVSFNFNESVVTTNWIFFRFPLDENKLFKQNQVLNFSLKLKYSNLSRVTIKIVRSGIGTYSNEISIGTGSINDVTEGNITGSITCNRAMKSTDSSTPLILEIVGHVYPLEANPINYPPIDKTKQSLLEVSNVILTESTNTTYEAYKNPSVNQYTIQRALPVKSDTVTFGVELGNISDITGRDYDDQNTVRSDFIKVIPDLTYYLYNSNNLVPFNVFMYDSNKTFLRYKLTDSTCRFTIPSNVAYIRFTRGNTYYDNLVFKADLPLRSLRARDIGNAAYNVYDEINVNTNKFIKRIGRITDIYKLVTASDFSYYNLYNYTDEFGQCFKCEKALVSDMAIENGPIWCNTLNNIVPNGQQYCVTKNPQPRLSFKIDTSVKTADDLIQWFKNNPTDILYVLATPEVYDLRDYTDIVPTLPNVYKDGTIQLDSSSETFPIIDYRTRSTNYYEFRAPYNALKVRCSLKSAPIDLYYTRLSDNGTLNISTKGDFVINNLSIRGMYSLLFNTPDIQDVLVTGGANDKTIPYTPFLSHVENPMIRNIGSNLFDGKFEGFIRYTDYYVKSLHLKPNTNYIIKTTLTGSKSITEGWCALGLWHYGKATNNGEYDYITYMIRTNGDIDSDGYKIFNTENYDIKLVAFIGSNISEAKKKFNDLLDNYKIELYEVPNNQEDTYKENTVKFLDSNYNEIILRSSQDNTYRDEIDLTNKTVTYNMGHIHLDGQILKNNPGSNLFMGGYRGGTLYEDAEPWNSDILCFEFRITGYIAKPGTASTTLISDPRFIAGNCSSDSGLVPTIEYYLNMLRIDIPKLWLHTPDKQGLLEWLDENPIDIIYVRENPIIEDIKVIGNPISYTNGNIALDSDGQIPTLEYKAIISTKEQIKSSTNEIKRQQSEIDKLFDIIRTKEGDNSNGQ